MHVSSDREKTVLMVVHQSTSTTGRVGRQLEARGYVQDRRCPNFGCELPADLEGYAGVAVFGGPMSANDDDEFEGICRELKWLESVVKADVPFLGVCLGAQLLARVLGARVSPHPDGVAEIGYHPVRPTQGFEGFFAEPLNAYQWHREGFELPDGAQLMATGDAYPNQAFKWGSNAYGVQFHPEVTRDIMLRWMRGGTRRLTLPGAQMPEAQRADNLRYDGVMERWLANFLDRWLVGESA
jgi:GMP synthase (glutamine-hydrolysing)